MMGRSFWVVALLGVMGVTGCAGEVIAVIDISGKKLAVIPFKDKIYPVGPSVEAIELSRAITSDIMEENLDDIDVIPSRVVEKFFGDRDVGKMSPQEIGESLGVDYVLFGDLHEFSASGNIIGLEQGILRCRITVQDIGNGAVVYDEDGIRVQYPTQPVMGLAEEAIRTGLIGRAGNRIGRRFYTHEPVKGEGLEVPR